MSLSFSFCQTQQKAAPKQKRIFCLSFGLQVKMVTLINQRSWCPPTIRCGNQILEFYWERLKMKSVRVCCVCVRVCVCNVCVSDSIPVKLVRARTCVLSWSEKISLASIFSLQISGFNARAPPLLSIFESLIQLLLRYSDVPSLISPGCPQKLQSWDQTSWRPHTQPTKAKNKIQNLSFFLIQIQINYILIARLEN